MSKGIGRIFSIGIAKEAVRGTAETAAAYWLPFSEAVMEDKTEKISIDQSFGVIEDSIDSELVKQWAEVNFKSIITDASFPLILKAALGTSASALHSTETIVYDHTITVNESAQHQSLSLFLNDPVSTSDYKHALGCLENLEIKIDPMALVQYTASFKAKKGATATLTPAQTVENRFHAKHATFKVAANLAGLTAASAVNIRNLSLKIAKNLEDDDALGSLDPVDFLNKQLIIEGTLEAVWQTEADFKTAYLANTKKALRIDLKNTDITIGTSANPQVQIDLAKVTFKELTRPLKINDTVMQTLSFKAHYSSSDTKMITVLCVNTVTTY